MNEYIPDPAYGQGMPGTEGSVVKSRIRYMNVILTVMLAVVIIASAVLAVMIAGISMESEKTGQALSDLNNDVGSIANEMYYISDNVDEIYSQGGGTSQGGSTYEPRWEEYTDKPVVYLYPDKDDVETHVELVMEDAEMVSMWPDAVQDGNKYSWDVCADSDGTIYDADGNEYSYLFWEAGGYGTHSFDEGFCVAGSDTAEFLRNTLSEIGLTPTEYNEFIVYWLPLMQDNAYNLITFEGLDPDDAYNSRFKLTVTDDEGNEADSVLRVLMVWKAADEPVEIKAQAFEGFERNGYTVVEWGGTEIVER